MAFYLFYLKLTSIWESTASPLYFSTDTKINRYAEEKTKHN